MEDTDKHGIQHADPKNGHKRPGLPVNMDAHEGLRGLLCMQIICFHSLYYSKAAQGCDERDDDDVWNGKDDDIYQKYDNGWDHFGVNLMGSASMTPFFLMCGFSLAVVYGTRKMDATFCKKSFWQNRIARTMPAYWLVNFLAFPVCFLGYGQPALFGPLSSTINTFTSFFYSIVPVWTWLFYNWGMMFCGPSWTIQTMWFFYFTFPWCMRFVQNYVGIGKKWTYQTSYWIFNLLQWLPAVAVYFIGSFLALSLPYTRLPLFFMGLIAGQELVEKKAQGLPHFGSKMFSPCCCCFASCCCKDDEVGLKAASDSNAPVPPKEDPAVWAKQVDMCSAGLVIFYILLIICRNMVTTYEGWGIMSLIGDGMFQMANAWPFLMLMVGLTRDEHMSMTAKFLMSPVMKFVGKISMSAYLIHEPLIYYLAYFFNGDADNEKNFSIRNNTCQRVPAYAVVIILPLGLLGGWLMTEFFEAPCRRLLRAKTPTKKTTDVPNSPVKNAEEVNTGRV